MADSWKRLAILEGKRLAKLLGVDLADNEYKALGEGAFLSAIDRAERAHAEALAAGLDAVDKAFAPTEEDTDGSAS